MDDVKEVGSMPKVMQGVMLNMRVVGETNVDNWTCSRASKNPK